MGATPVDVQFPEISGTKPTVLSVNRFACDGTRSVVRVGLGYEVIGAAPFQTDPRNDSTTLAGLAKRVCRKVPEPKHAPESSQDSCTTQNNTNCLHATCKCKRPNLACFKRFVGSWLRANLTPLSPGSDLGIDAWLEQTNYTQTRKEQLRQAAASVSGRRPRTVVKSFVKDEMYTEPKHSRGIYSRHDEFKVVVGPVFKLIERALFDGPNTKQYFIKKVPAAERAKFVWERLSGKGTKTMATDYTAFESHFVRKFMEACEFQLYDHMVSELNCPSFKNFVGIIKGMNRIAFKRFSLKLEATRMSGEMNTSLGNSFANLMVFLYLHRNNSNVDCLVEGDDCLGVFDGEYPTSQDYKDLGLTVKIEKPESIQTASFCGQVFATDYTTLTDPIKFILKFNWTSAMYSDCNDKTLHKLAKAKAMSALAQYPRCPVVTSFAKYVYRTSGLHWKIDDSKSNWEKNRLKQLLRDFQLPTEPVTEEARILVAKMWGVTIPQQLQLEHHFDSAISKQPVTDPMVSYLSTPAQREFYWKFVSYVPVGWASPYYWVFRFDGTSTKATPRARCSKAGSCKASKTTNRP